MAGTLVQKPSLVFNAGTDVSTVFFRFGIHVHVMNISSISLLKKLYHICRCDESLTTTD